SRPARRPVDLPRRPHRRGCARRLHSGRAGFSRARAATVGDDLARGVMEPRVLIVEDDAELRGILVRGLAEEGFRTEATSNGPDLLRRAVAAPADALVVDIGLPDTDGRDLCQALRAQGVEAPVLFLTARDGLVERLAGFNAGGDDYLTDRKSGV